MGKHISTERSAPSEAVTAINERAYQRGDVIMHFRKLCYLLTVVFRPVNTKAE